MKRLYNYLLLLFLASLSLSLFAQNGIVCSNHINGAGGYAYGVYAIDNKVYVATTGGLGISTNGGATFDIRDPFNSMLGNNSVRGVYAVGDTIYAATAGGLSISTNGGLTFNNRTTSNSMLGANFVWDVYTVGNTVYAATNGGLSISTNGGTTFTTYTTPQLGSNSVRGVYAVGNTIYAATSGGLSISTDGGATFNNRTTSNSMLGSNIIYGVYAVGNTIYAATNGGLSISTDGGATFNNRTFTNSTLGNNSVNDVYAIGNTIYAATAGGLSISTNGGISFTNYLESSSVNDVYVDVTTGKIYAATSDGLSFCQDAALPVSLLYFKGKAIQTAEGYASELTWATSSEVNAKSYTIERSRDLQTFTTLSNQPAAGNSTEQLAYNYTDSQPHFGTNYYRLSQIDFDGSVHRYQPIAVVIEDRDMPFGVFPNPVSGSRFKVKVEATDETQLSLFNELGQKIAIETTKLSETVVEIQTKTDLPSGSYIVKVQGLVGVKTHKITAP
jgi:Secretion system C-terminal sorting domain